MGRSAGEGRSEPARSIPRRSTTRSCACCVSPLGSGPSRARPQAARRRSTTRKSRPCFAGSPRRASSSPVTSARCSRSTTAGLSGWRSSGQTPPRPGRLGGGSATVLPAVHACLPSRGCAPLCNPAVHRHSQPGACSRAAESRWRPVSCLHVPGKSESGVELRFLWSPTGRVRERTPPRVCIQVARVAQRRRGGPRIEVHAVLRAARHGTRRDRGVRASAATAWPSTARRCSTSGSSCLRAPTSSRG